MSAAERIVMFLLSLAFAGLFFCGLYVAMVAVFGIASMPRGDRWPGVVLLVLAALLCAPLVALSVLSHHCSWAWCVP